MAWDEDKKAKAVQLYLAGKPTAENSVELVKEVADELGETVNGVRMILQKAEVYVKKDTAPSTKAKAPDKEKKSSKADLIDGLKAAIIDIGGTPDMEILDKLTGKVAQYFTALIEKASKQN
jgi:hypothetical protein